MSEKAGFSKGLLSALLLGITIATTIGCGSQVQLPNTTGPHQSQLTNQPPDDAGLVASFIFTPLTASVDTRKIYVSSSDGTDQADCLTEQSSCTLARGISMMRNGYPDWLLIKRGDVFNGSLSLGWSKSGRSASEPMVIATYGNAAARPQFLTGSANGFANHLHDELKHLHLIGLSFIAQTRDPRRPEFTGASGGVGISLLAWGHAVEDILIEGCEIGFYSVNIVAHNDLITPIANIRLRANQVHDSWKPAAQGFSQGIYANSIDGLLLEQNVFDHNGGLFNYPGDQRFTVPQALNLSEVTVSWFNHQVYSDAQNRNVVVRNNIFANGDGVQVRAGGIVHGNIFLRTINGLTGGSDDDLNQLGGFDFDVQNNLFIEGTDFPAQSTTPGARGIGVALTNTSLSGALVANNTFYNDISLQPHGVAIALEGKICNPQSNNPIACPVRRANVSHNFIHDWRGGIQLRGVPGADLLEVDITANQVQLPGSTQAPVVFATALNPLHIRWASNRYFSGRSDGKWFNINYVDQAFSSWQATSGENAAELLAVPTTNDDLRLQELILGAGANYDAALQSLTHQTPWQWQAAFETVELIRQFQSRL